MSRVAASPGMNRRTLAITGIVVLVVAIIVAVGFASRIPKAATNAPLAPAKIANGQPAPDFTVQTDNGAFALKDVSTPVLLEVFATWCPHCQRETVILNNVAAKYAGKVAIVGVSGSPYAIDGSAAESQTDVNAFAQRFALKYPVAYDPTLDVARAYMQTGFPTVVLIGKDKKIAWFADGEIPQKLLEQQIQKTL